LHLHISKICLYGESRKEKNNSRTHFQAEILHEHLGVRNVIEKEAAGNNFSSFKFLKVFNAANTTPFPYIGMKEYLLHLNFKVR